MCEERGAGAGRGRGATAQGERRASAGRAHRAAEGSLFSCGANCSRPSARAARVASTTFRAGNLSLGWLIDHLNAGKSRCEVLATAWGILCEERGAGAGRGRGATAQGERRASAGRAHRAAEGSLFSCGANCSRPSARAARVASTTFRAGNLSLGWLIDHLNAGKSRCEVLATAWGILCEERGAGAGRGRGATAQGERRASAGRTTSAAPRPTGR